MRTISALWGLGAGLLAVSSLNAGEPVALRVEAFRVPPSTQPLVSVQVKNLQALPYQGAVTMAPPQDWKISPPQREVVLQPGETQRVAFAVEHAPGSTTNRYLVDVSATSGGTKVARRQEVFCATAPFLKPSIDGDPAEWNAAIPVAFATGGRTTTLSTGWNRKEFALLVAVDEHALRPYAPGEPFRPFDAVQIAISPADAQANSLADSPAERYEFLLVALGEDGPGTCFRLAEPQTPLADTQRERRLAGLEAADARVVVRRRDGVTYYEASLPFASMKSRIRPSEGREFFLSVLVHDADGTGLRDLGEAAGFWPEQRSSQAWSRWAGAAWPAVPPYDNKVEWGLSSSKY